MNGSTLQFDLTGSVGVTGDNRANDVRRIRERLGSLGFDWIAADGGADQLLIDTIKLFQSIVRGSNTIVGDGRIDPGGSTHRWLQAVNAPRWIMLPAGSAAEGFRNIEVADLADHHDFGVDWLAKTIAAAGNRYRVTYLATHPAAALIMVNDASLPRGGDTKDHAGHECGLACDIRLPRKDGTAPGQTTVNHPNYDREATRGMLNSFRAQALFDRIFLNDATLIAEGICSSAAGHDDHAHVQVKPPPRQDPPALVA